MYLINKGKNKIEPLEEVSFKAAGSASANTFKNGSQKLRRPLEKTYSLSKKSSPDSPIRTND